jgi:hypothetical protein
MDYKITETWIDDDRLCCRVAMIHSKDFEEIVMVQTKLPKTKQDVIAEIEKRCKAETIKYNYIAQITPIKEEVDRDVDVVKTAEIP